MEEIAGRIAQMEAVIQALRTENLALQQQQRGTWLQAITGLVQHAQMEGLIDALADQGAGVV